MNCDFLIREWNPSDSVSALTRLLHDAYAPLAAKGFRFLASHEDDTMTLRRLSEGWSFVLERDREVIVTIGLRGPDAGSECEWYCRPDVFNESGGLENNIARLKQIYHNQIQVMYEPLRRYLPQAKYEIPHGGYFFWLNTPKAWTSARSAKEQARSTWIFARARCFQVVAG